MTNIKCEDCEEYRDEWCHKIIDSPISDMLRDCQYFHERDKDIVKVIRCKDCKHRPVDSEDTQGFGVEFPDEKCPCQCEDGWYNWRPDDEWFCANAERRTDEQIC